MKYRMYVDEVGNSDLGASDDPNHRYLSLTGVVLSLEYVDRTVFPALEDVKRRFFGSHPDEPIILHRKELVNKKPPFECLRDPVAEQAFNRELMQFLADIDYTVFTVVIDKKEHRERYQVWRHDPYHYCLLVLLERYVLWLKRRDVVGDVMAESRGGKEDRRLKESYERVYDSGSGYVARQQFTACLTSRQLKVKQKANNIAGLQIADLIAHPSYRATLARREQTPLPTNFGGKIAEILENGKYDRDANGVIDRWGRKWLP
ncbi:MAG TPA: DUF3800 domain-containing protein [Pirellulales bacterium]|nr:DUF3800 domain-containing protein [Pirellulales bacterium]